MATNKWADVRRRKLGPEGEERVRRRVEATLFEMNLAELRKELGATQVEAAERADMAQSELSRIERGQDHLVSTLRRVVRALGGELEVTAVVDGKRVKLAV